MLRDWSDREPPQPRRPFVLSVEFAAGVLTAFVGMAIVVGMMQLATGR